VPVVLRAARGTLLPAKFAFVRPVEAGQARKPGVCRACPVDLGRDSDSRWFDASSAKYPDGFSEETAALRRVAHALNERELRGKRGDAKDGPVLDELRNLFLVTLQDRVECRRVVDVYGVRQVDEMLNVVP
jgi:hypothetical protein